MPPLLPSFDADFTQDTRLLRLTTPLGGNQLLAESVHGEESIGGGYSFRITALSLDAGISLRALLGQPALLELQVADSGIRRPFHGYLTSAELNGANGGFARYTLTLQPWTAFLAHGRDSRIFQNKSVPDILDAVFASWQGKGKLAPEWRFELSDRSVYPTRSLATQYQESDLAFVERLMSEEGLYYFFEHSADGHCMVIADHNGVFRPNAQPLVRFTQASAVMREDSMDRWRREVRAHANAVRLGSWDYRSRGMRNVSAAGAPVVGSDIVRADVPGVYAYADRAHSERLAERQLQALEAHRDTYIGAGTLRRLAAGTTFTLTDHPNHDGSEDDAFLVTRVLHQMHNNLSAELKAAAEARLGALPLTDAAGLAGSRHAVGSGPGERPLYRNCVHAIRASTPYRGIVEVRERPTVHGQQTAIVVGPPGAVIHTDRDHRIKVQFHWQRDAGTHASHSRLSHPDSDGQTGAPGDDSAGTWVRVATPLAPIAGANWGSHALPRVGQEVLVDFMEGDIDRPVVIGALYNGRGQTDAQYNTAASGAGSATGNAPAWFPGESGAHAHPAALSGMKSQALQSSQDGSGAYSQLLFDDSARQSRLSLQRHAAAHKGTDELNLGCLRHQTDNRRLDHIGFGAELKSEHNAALRAGQGMLLSTHAGSGSASSRSQLDSGEAYQQLNASQQLAQSLAETAKKHNPHLKGEPDGNSVAAEQMAQSGRAIASMQSGATQYGEPQLQLAGAAGIAAVTPSSAIFSAQLTSSICAGHDVNLVSGQDLSSLAANGLGMFTYGKVEGKTRPNLETGIRMHAASGKLTMQSQSGRTSLVAKKAVTVTSVSKSVTVSAPHKHVLLTAGGAGIKLEGGDITIQGPGAVHFKASMKELAGPVSVPSAELAMKVHELQLKRDLEIEYVDADGNALTGEPIDLRFASGDSKTVTLGNDGRATLKDAPLGPFGAKQPKRR